MPKIVDHARRREEIAALTVRVIRREGAASATIRRIAQEGGFSVGVLGHYFSAKDDLVAFAFQWMATQTFKDLDAAVAAAAPGVARLRAAMEFMVPTPGEPSFMAVWVGLWDGALKNPALARVHRAYYARWRRRLRRYVGDAICQGEIVSPRSLVDAVDLLVSAMDGLWIGVTFEPGRLPLARRRTLVAQVLDAVLGDR